MANAILSLSDHFVREHLLYPQLVNAVGSALTRLSKKKSNEEKGPNRIQQPLRTVLTTTDSSGHFLNMSSYMADEGVFGTKLVTLFSGNTDLPTHQGIVVIFDATNGKPLALMGAEEITARRTAAASALASMHMAPRRSSCLAVLGAGTQAQSHIEAHLSVIPTLERVHVWNRTRERAETLVKKMKTINSKVIYQVHDSVKEAVANADIVCTVTSATSPILDGKWLTRPGVHVNAVGAPRPNWRELETNVLTGRFVAADSLEAAMNESGDIIAAGVRVEAELGEIVADGLPVDRDTVPTVFKSLGVAVEDLIAAKLVYDAYKSVSKM